MFDINKRKRIDTPKVKDLISVLDTLNPEGNIIVDGLDSFFIHISEDDNLVSLDLSDMDAEYEEDFKLKNKKFKRKYWAEYLEPEKYNNHLSRKRCLELLKLIKDKLEPEYLISLGFTEEELNYIEKGR